MKLHLITEEIWYQDNQDLSGYRIDHLKALCPPHISLMKNLVRYDKHKPYLRTPYLNPYQKFFSLVGKESKDSKL